MIGPGPKEKESGRWVAVTLLAAVLPTALTQVGEGVREKPRFFAHATQIARRFWRRSHDLRSRRASRRRIADVAGRVLR